MNDRDVEKKRADVVAELDKLYPSRYGERDLSVVNALMLAVVNETLAKARFALDSKIPWVVELRKTLEGGSRVSTNAPEPPPTPNDNTPIWDLVIADMQERNKIGMEKYGTPLQAHNGRKPLVDLYQELLDAVVYARQEIEERNSL